MHESPEQSEEHRAERGRERSKKGRTERVENKNESSKCVNIECSFALVFLRKFLDNLGKALCFRSSSEPSKGSTSTCVTIYIIKGGCGVGRFLSSSPLKMSRNWQTAENLEMRDQYRVYVCRFAQRKRSKRREPM